MTVSLNDTPTTSPCIGVCITDAKWQKYCIGCGRWINEIQNWDLYTPWEKKMVNKRINDLKEESTEDYPYK